MRFVAPNLAVPAALSFSVQLSLLAGCGASTQDPETTALRAKQREAAKELETLREDTRDKHGEIRDLKGRLAMAKAESRQLRQKIERNAALARKTVRIGASASEESSWEKIDDTDDGKPRPFLRLYGPDGRDTGGGYSTWSPNAVNTGTSNGGGEPPLIIPDAPDGVAAKLNVVPLPEGSKSFASSMGSTKTDGSFRPGVVDAAANEYRSALAYVKDRKYANALEALTAFVRAHPAHGYADNALHWKGEVLYALRRYDLALRTFEQVVTKYPKGNKVPDALYKAGLCHQRLGDSHRSLAYFKRLKQVFPQSVAARLASREEKR